MLLKPWHPAIERFGNGVQKFYFGDMRTRLTQMCEKMAGEVQLAYLDPPFATGQLFTHKIRVGGGEAHMQGYHDPASIQAHCELLRTALEAIWRLLAPTGAVVVHVDHRLSAHVRLMLDDIFGAKNFVNEIIWAYASGGRATRHFSRKHDTLFVYRKSKAMYFDLQAVGEPRGKERRNHMKRVVDEEGRVHYSIRSNGKLYTYGEDSLIYPSDVWTDIPHLQQRDPERTGYATQKPEALLERLLKSMARGGDVVLDPCSGSGTTAVVANRLGMRFIAVDNAALAAHTLRSRLLAGSEVPNAAFYDVPCSEFFAPVHVEKCDAKLRVGLKTAYAQQAACEPALDAVIIYWALGVCDGAAFIPMAVQSRWKREFAMQMEAEIQGNMALHIVNASGQQAFWLIRDE